MDISVEWLGSGDRGIIVLKSNADQKKLLAERLESKETRFNVTALLDTSGSMKKHESMLNNSLQTLKKLLPGCAKTRTIVFDDYAREVTLSQVSVSSGQTNLASALEMIRNEKNPQLVLLLSDGHANTGTFTTPEKVLDYSRLLYAPYDAPIIFTTIGFNEPKNLQLEILNGLAHYTDGNSHIVQTEEGVYGAFGDIVSDLISITHADITFHDVETWENRLHGIHLRVGEKREIPFIYKGHDLTIKSWNVDTREWTQQTIKLVPEIHDEKPHIKEFFLLKEGKDLLKSFIESRAHFEALARNLHDPFEETPYYASPSLENAFGRGPKRFRETIAKLNNEARAENVNKLRKIMDPAKAAIASFLQDLPSSKLLDALLLELTRLDMNENDFSALEFDFATRRSRIGGFVAFDPTASQQASRDISRHVSLNPEADGQVMLTQRL